MRQIIRVLSTAVWVKRFDETDLCTELSTLSTFSGVDNVVYIVFFLNRRFVNIDKKEQMRKKTGKKLDRLNLEAIR